MKPILCDSFLRIAIIIIQICSCHVYPAGIIAGVKINCHARYNSDAIKLAACCCVVSEWALNTVHWTPVRSVCPCDAGWKYKNYFIVTHLGVVWPQASPNFILQQPMQERSTLSLKWRTLSARRSLWPIWHAGSSVHHELTNCIGNSPRFKTLTSAQLLQRYTRHASHDLTMRYLIDPPVGGHSVCDVLCGSSTSHVNENNAMWPGRRRHSTCKCMTIGGGRL